MIESLESFVKRFSKEVERLSSAVNELFSEIEKGESTAKQSDRVLDDAKKSLIIITEQAKLDRDNK